VVGGDADVDHLQAVTVRARKIERGSKEKRKEGETPRILVAEENVATGGVRERPTSPGDRPLSLHPTTLMGAGPLEVVGAAAMAGFPMVGVRLTPAHPGDPSPCLLKDRGLLRRLCRALRDHGLRVLEAELIRLQPDTEGGGFERHLESAAELNAAFVLTVSHDPDLGRAADRLAQLAEGAASRGLRIGLEFMAFTEVKTASAARELLRRVGHPALGVLADALHLARSGDGPEALAALPLLAAQICDARRLPPADLAWEARHARLLPGEGELRLQAFVAALPPGLPVSVEAPGRSTESWTKRAQQALAAARAVIKGAPDRTHERRPKAEEKDRLRTHRGQIAGCVQG
jgi:sugar phosphate isomerase/epimerase